MSIAQTATNAFKTGLMNGTFNFSTGTFKIALYTASASLDATTAAYTSANEVTASGYTAGGQALTVSVTPTTGDTGTTAYISFANVSWTAALTARAALIYEVSSGNPSVCVLDFGSDKTSTTTFTVQFPAATNTSAIIRIA
jgi:hypothetical protein